MGTTMPILKLPIKAFLTVLQVMGFVNLFVLTRVSKRMKSIVKENVKVRNYTLTITFQTAYEFITQSDKNEAVMEAFTVLPKDASKPVPFSIEIGNFEQVPFNFIMSFGLVPVIETYWDDMFVGIKEFYGELFELFPMPFFGLKMNLSQVKSNYRSIITWFNSLHPHVRIIEIYGNDIDFRRYLYVMKHLKPTDRLTMDARPIGYYETGSIEFSVDELWVKYAQWILPSHIREMKSTKISFWRTNFTDEELNELFCSLKAGSNPQLRKMDFSIWRRVNPETFLRNLNATDLTDYSWSFVLAGRRRCVVSCEQSCRDPNRFQFYLSIEKLPRLPLLKLPDLALVNVLETMKFVNLFMFANLSKRMKRIIKDNVKVRHHNLTIFMAPNFGLTFCSTKNQKLFEYFPMNPVGTSTSASNCRNFFEKIGETSQIPFRLIQDDTNCIWTFWNDRFTGVKEMYKEIIELFSITLTHIQIYLDVIEDKFQSVISWINELNPRVPTLYVGGENCDFQQIISTIEQVLTGKLELYATPRAYLETEQLVTNVDQIIIHTGQWIKVKHLQSLSSSRIEINNSYFEDEEINEFLRLLKAGSNPNLKRCILQFIGNADLPVVFEGLEATGADGEWGFQLENGGRCTVIYSNKDDVHPNLRELQIDIERNEEESTS